MTGLPDLGRARFAAAQEALTAAGHVAINPGVLPVGLDPGDYMPICLAMLEAADAVYLLDNYEDSFGAHLEMCYATYQGKPIYREGSEKDNKRLFEGVKA